MMIPTIHGSLKPFPGAAIVSLLRSRRKARTSRRYLSAGAQTRTAPRPSALILRTLTADIFRSRSSRPLLYGLSAVVLLLLAGLGWYVRRNAPPAKTAPLRPTTATVASMRLSVAVLGFHNLSGQADDRWLATAFSEMLSTELAAGGKLRLVSGEDVANLLLSSPWSQTDTLGQKTTARIGTALNSDVLVLGLLRQHRQTRA